MKKFTVLLLTGLLAAAALVACSSAPSGPSGTASEIADKVFEESGVEPFGMADTIDDEDKMNWYLGSTNYSELAESAVVLPMISLDTRSLYILKANSDGDVDGILAQLTEDIDPNKLICVSFSLEDVVIESRGDVIFMTINSNVEQREALVTAFAGIE
ncbi:MAG: hypothetical protein HQ478_15785 [Chloroflexi bacterium]|nr:hypothetical protein [Chloroflexota bacterium]